MVLYYLVVVVGIAPLGRHGMLCMVKVNVGVIVIESPTERTYPSTREFTSPLITRLLRRSTCTLTTTRGKSPGHGRFWRHMS